MGCRFQLNLLLWRRKIVHYIDYYIPISVKPGHLIPRQNLLYTFFKQPIFGMINILVDAIYWDIGGEITYMIQKAIFYAIKVKIVLFCIGCYIISISEVKLCWIFPRLLLWYSGLGFHQKCHWKFSIPARWASNSLLRQYGFLIVWQKFWRF